MSEETDKPEGGPEQESTKPEEQVTDPRTPITLTYAGASQPTSRTSGPDGAGTEAKLALFTNTRRADVRAELTAKDPLTLREALSCLYEVVSSDFRYVPRDKTAYLAYMRLRKSMAGQGGGAGPAGVLRVAAAQRPAAWLVLDPIVTVHPDRLLRGVQQGRGRVRPARRRPVGLRGRRRRTRHGTTNIDFSQALFDGVQRMRSYRPTQLSIGRDAVSVHTEGSPRCSRRRSRSPTRGCAGSSRCSRPRPCRPRVVTSRRSTSTTCSGSSACNADRKKGGRGVRIELVPGEAAAPRARAVGDRV